MMIDYVQLYEKAQIVSHYRQVVQFAARVVTRNRGPYEHVAMLSDVPWWCIGALHFRECGANWHCHLHNGDPLSHRTVHTPKGRPLAAPASGSLPYQWYESALDALHDRWKPESWGVQGCLEFLERYNGLGYHLRGIHSPYLWSFTDQYTGGLFFADGHFDPEARSQQVGCAALFKVMEEDGTIKIVP